MLPGGIAYSFDAADAAANAATSHDTEKNGRRPNNVFLFCLALDATGALF